GGVLALALLVCPFAISMFAQNTNTPAGTPVQTVRDDDRDWGWLGLIGLLGLAGLLRRRDKPERDHNLDRDRDRR
ncbi:MAG TPA: WGxxGxxG family protein, partial [Pirellula sp.]|nr:WGxxGxxG family protein [Pirellula sp.]